MGLLSNVEYFLKCGEKQCGLTFGRIYAFASNKSQPKRRWVHEEYKPANYGKNRTFQRLNFLLMTTKYVPVLEQTAKENAILFHAIHIESREDAQSAPTPITNYAMFHDGEYITNEQMNEKKFLKLVNA